MDKWVIHYSTEKVPDFHALLSKLLLYFIKYSVLWKENALYHSDWSFLHILARLIKTSLQISESVYNIWTLLHIITINV